MIRYTRTQAEQLVSAVGSYASTGAIGGCSLLTLFALAACRDSSQRAIAPSAIDSVSVDTSAARQRLEQLNPQRWVGANHNAGIDIVRSAFRKHRLAGLQACREFMELDFSSLLPVGLRDQRHLTLARQLLLNGVAGGPCQPASQATVRHAKQGSSLTPLAESLLGQVDAALASATSPGDFAARLVPIVAAAQSLPTGDREVVSSAASVAQSSADYWDANWGGFVSDLGSQYRSCLTNAPNWEECRGSLASRWNGNDEVRVGPFTLLPLSTFGASTSCARVTHPFKTVGAADFKAAIGGAIGGLYAGGPQGAVLGAIVGGMAGSVSTAVSRGLWEFVTCDLMQ